MRSSGRCPFLRSSSAVKTSLRRSTTATIGFRKGKKGQLRFEHDGFELVVSGPGASHSIHATGNWPRSVRTDAGMMKALARRLPVQDPLTLRANDGRLKIGSLSVPAELLAIAPAAVHLPIGADAVAVLTAVEKYGEVRVKGVIGAATIDSADRILADVHCRAAAYRRRTDSLCDGAARSSNFDRLRASSSPSSVLPRRNRPNSTVTFIIRVANGSTQWSTTFPEADILLTSGTGKLSRSQVLLLVLLLGLAGQVKIGGPGNNLDNEGRDHACSDRTRLRRHSISG